jgi:FkbM family methyltransferase
LGKYGFTILTFEPSPLNYYYSRKNYCLLNKKSSVVIITKGLYNEEKICDYYKDIKCSLNGMTLCNGKIKNISLSKQFIKNGTVALTKLSNFIPYLSDKNIALIKMDVEGSEGKAIEGGLELITKYHVPFILIKFTPIFLREHNTDPRQLIQLFVDNGYKISLDGFLSKNYLNVDELLNKAGFQVNCYFIHESIINLMK